MKKLLILAATLSMGVSAFAWAPKGDKIKTRWAKDVTPQTVWQSYPRPQLVRDQWVNLNGLWNYAVTGQDAQRKNVDFNGEILVPFAIESSLSGVQYSFQPNDMLWYQREFTVPADWKGDDIILHFGAVDYACTVWVNGKEVGSHRGGNNPFSFDITKYLKRSGNQTVELSVVDPTDKESISRGKQQLDQKGIWYTPVSGIWKSVWLEPVGDTHIKYVHAESDIESMKVTLDLNVIGGNGRETAVVKVFDNDKLLTTVEGAANSAIEIAMPNGQLWTPNTPKLYDIEVSLMKGSKLLDKARSYFAIREVEMKKDANGYYRIALNNEITFQYGTLDQGWWPDGLLTPPTEEAMLWDMEQLKAMGFNTIRKHIKVEPELYYYYADSLGLMVWQDMVSGFATERKNEEHIKADAKNDWNASAEHTAQWQGEMFEMIDNLRFYPSITTWVVFNEGWGQHNTKEIVEKVEAYDTTRIIDGVTGWTDRNVGDLYDVHNYPGTSMVLPENCPGRSSVLGEFGGFGWAVENHLWNPEKRNWGYVNVSGAMDFINSYGGVVYDLESLIAQGLSAAIYTQTTDVEGEVNGLITYDREVIKIPTKLLHSMHSKLYIQPSKKIVDLLEDGQRGNTRTVMASIDGAAPASLTLPLKDWNSKSICTEVEFDVDQDFDNLILWTNTRAYLNIEINGVKVFDRAVNQTRHHNQYNISDYIHTLHKGKNVIKIEAVRENKGGAEAFDFGLRAY